LRRNAQKSFSIKHFGRYDVQLNKFDLGSHHGINLTACAAWNPSSLSVKLVFYLSKIWLNARLNGPIPNCHDKLLLRGLYQ